MTSVEGSTWAPLWVGFSGEDKKTDLNTCTAQTGFFTHRTGYSEYHLSFCIFYHITFFKKKQKHITYNLG